MTTGQVKSYFSHKPHGQDGPYRVVRLELDNQEVFSYIEFEDGRAGVEIDGIKDSVFWFHDKGVPPALLMEFFLTCFEAPVPDTRGWHEGKIHEW